MEFCCYGFVGVAYAAGVSAFYYAFDELGQLNFHLVDNGVVADKIDRCMGRDKCNTIDFLRAKSFALDFHYVFDADSFAGYIYGYGHNAFLFAGYAQNFYNVKRVAAADVIDDGSVFDFVNPQLFLTHAYRPVKL